MSELDELKAFLFKIMIPAFVALSIKIAIMSSKQKVTIFQVVASFVSGVGSAYLFSDMIMESLSDKWIPLAVAVVTISGEKIGYWLIYKFNVEQAMEDVVKRYTRK